MGYAAMAVPCCPDRGGDDGSSKGRGERTDSVGVNTPDPDVLDDLGDEIATIAAHIHSATHRLLALLARFDRLRGWERAGHRTCAHWLSFRSGLDLGTAREHVRVARALDELPNTEAAMARGELSFSKVRALTRVAEAANETELLELAQGSTTEQLERMVRAWKKGSRKDEQAWERERHRSRAFSVFPDDDGMYLVQGRLDPEVGALLMRAVEAAADALYRDRMRELRLANDRAAEPSSDGETSRVRDDGRDAARRRADAVGLMAERALGAGFTASDAKASGTRAERFQVLLHVDQETLAATGEPGRSELEDGTRVSAETSRRLSCDAGLVRITHAARESAGGDSTPADDPVAGHGQAADRCAADGSAADGSGVDGSAADRSVIDVGRRTRTIPPALRRALDARDRGCRFPGCGLRFTEAHHVVHWADGGETSLDNTLLLCRYHHRLVHEEGWSIDWWGRGRAVFKDPRGTAHVSGQVPSVRLPDDPVSAMVRRNRLRGADPGAWTAASRWRSERDIPDAVLFRASEAAM